MKDVKGLRSIQEIARRTNTNPNVIVRIGAMYHWPLRCKAYDSFRNLELQTIRTRDIAKIQNDHKQTAENLRLLAMGYLEENIELLNPKNAIDMMKLAVELERLSVGMSPNKADSEIEANRGPTINVTNQSINAGGSSASPAAAGGGSNNDRVGDILSVLMQSRAFDAAAAGRKEVGEGEHE
jgi:hypothetical protein